MAKRPQARPASPSGKRLVADARAALDGCLGLKLRAAARQATRLLEGHLAAVGLGLAQLGLMARIAAAEDDTIGALAERAGLEQSTLSRNLRGLERAGLVEIAIVERDLRRRAVWLTESGARRLEAALPLWREAQRRLAAALDGEAVEALGRQAAALPAPGAERGRPARPPAG